MSKPPQNNLSRRSRWLKLVTFAVVVAYVLVCVLMALFQRQLLYHPYVMTPAQTDAAAQERHMERWYNAAGQPIGMKRLCLQRPAQAQALLTYGNGSHATGNPGYFDNLQNLGRFDIYILNYPGYEDRPGTPTQANLFHAADDAMASLSTNLPLYLIGQSLGTGVAAYLAGTYPDRVKGVVLQAPFNHMSAVAQYHYPWLPVSLLLLDRFASDDYLSHYHGPVGIMLGEVDQVVPPQFGRRLYDGYAGPKQVWVFPGANHGDVFYKIPDIAPDLKKLWGFP